MVALNRQVNSLESVVATLADETSLNAAVCPNPNLRILAPITESSVAGGGDVAIFGTAVHPDAARYQLNSALLALNCGSWLACSAAKPTSACCSIGTPANGRWAGMMCG